MTSQLRGVHLSRRGRMNMAPAMCVGIYKVYKCVCSDLNTAVTWWVLCCSQSEKQTCWDPGHSDIAVLGVFIIKSRFPAVWSVLQGGKLALSTYCLHRIYALLLTHIATLDWEDPKHTEGFTPQLCNQSDSSTGFLSLASDLFRFIFMTNTQQPFASYCRQHSDRK